VKSTNLEDLSFPNFVLPECFVANLSFPTGVGQFHTDKVVNSITELYFHILVFTVLYTRQKGKMI